MIWHNIAMQIEGPKLLILDSYPLHRDLEYSFSKYDTHVMYIPKGLTWALQPLDCGFFKVLKDELKKQWISAQQRIFKDEKERREALSFNLKEIFYLQCENRNLVFWDKAGLEYPQNMLMIEENSEVMQEERASDMVIEEDNDSDINLFAN